jgi:hypothetical protein
MRDNYEVEEEKINASEVRAIVALQGKVHGSDLKMQSLRKCKIVAAKVMEEQNRCKSRTKKECKLI